MNAITRYRYDDADLTPPKPGKELVHTVGLVISRPGVGPKTGGRHLGVPLAIGPLHTRFRRLHDNVEVTLPNEDLELWTNSFLVGADRTGFVGNLFERPGWEFLRWSIADHVAHDLAAEVAEEKEDEPEIVPVFADDEPLVIIPCGKVKSDFTQKAGDMYLGGYHKLAQRAARAITSPDNIRILSAKYGLMTLDQVIEPYELRLGQDGSIEEVDVMDQAFTHGLVGHRNVVVLAGADYARLALTVWPDARTPLAGTKGMGHQQQRMSLIAAGRAVV